MITSTPLSISSFLYSCSNLFISSVLFLCHSLISKFILFCFFQPKNRESLNAFLKPLAYISSFFGTQPLITQVPPSLSASIKATFAPSTADLLAHATPPEPPPSTTKSYFIQINSFLVKY